VSKTQGDFESAIYEYNRSIFELERLKGNVITEYQADFLEDKQSVYEEIVSTYLDLGRDDQALVFAERAKSRALLELLAYKVDLGFRAREKADEPLVVKINAIRKERDQLLIYGRNLSAGYIESENINLAEIQREILSKEEQITKLWHQLLLRNSDYGRDLSLWEVPTEFAQPYLDADTAMVEYFTIGDEIVLFLVTPDQNNASDSLLACRLSTHLTKVKRLLQSLRLNLHSVPKSAPERMPDLTRNIQGVLSQLYASLLSPVHDTLKSYKNLILIPHGVLHYMPFHALYDGEHYVIEKWLVSYLPSASFFHYFRNIKINNDGVLSVGNSSNGDLPYAIKEASMVAEMFGGSPLLESEAMIDRVCKDAKGKRVVHLASHAEFRPDNPLFSGLELSDGWLTTLDIFNMRLQASLVTLSACQTGRSVVSGGDELLGLLRAFLAAGAASLLISHWAVEDRSTSLLMEKFYACLENGASKGRALQAAQVHLLRGQESEGSDGGEKLPAIYAHPYYWAPYFLIGDFGKL
jgi:CHAT domain-containing protein